MEERPSGSQAGRLIEIARVESGPTGRGARMQLGVELRPGGDGARLELKAISGRTIGMRLSSGRAVGAIETSSRGRRPSGGFEESVEEGVIDVSGKSWEGGWGEGAHWRAAAAGGQAEERREAGGMTDWG